jgi:hypothetical protein
MDEPEDREYYTRRQAEILALFDDHALAWRPFLVGLCGSDEADAILREARRRHEALIPQLPYIGGDENPMTRHLIRSTTSLALYQAMKAHGRTAAETGHVIYQAVVERVGQLPPQSPQGASAEELARQKEAARRSQARRYPADWVWEFVEGDGVEFDYGYDFSACATYRLYHAQGAGEFLPFYCYLDFATHRRPGWGFARTMTLAEGHGKCAFRFKKGGETRRGWPPPFLQ